MLYIGFEPRAPGQDNLFEDGSFVFSARDGVNWKAFQETELLPTDIKTHKIGKELFLSAYCAPKIPFQKIDAAIVQQMLSGNTAYLGKTICPGITKQLQNHLLKIPPVPSTPALELFYRDAHFAIPLTKPLAIVVLGGIGAGKSHFIRELRPHIRRQFPGEIPVADADRFRDPSKVDPAEFDLEEHNSCLEKRKRYIHHCKEQGIAFFFPTIGRHEPSTVEIIDNLKADGFEVMIMHISASQETVEERIALRERKEGRGVFGSKTQIATSLRRSLHTAENLAEKHSVTFVTNEKDINSALETVSAPIVAHLKEHSKSRMAAPKKLDLNEASTAIPIESGQNLSRRGRVIHKRLTDAHDEAEARAQRPKSAGSSLSQDSGYNE